MSLRIAISDLQYPGSPHALLSRLELHIHPGELYLLKGGNGSGKTTLLNCVAGVIPEHISALGKISIYYEGIALSDLGLRHKTAYLAYQMADTSTQLLFPSQEKELCFALENQGLAPAEMSNRLKAAISSFGLEPLLDLDPHLLSQGQKKLLLLAICQAMDTPIILLDEPSESLSGSGRELLTKWITGQLAQGKIILAAEHHNCLNSLATRIIDLDER